jgi:hypothetical protein
MARPVSPPNPEDIARWRKRVEEVRAELFNKPCKKQSSRFIPKHDKKEMEEDVLRAFLFDTFDGAVQR